MLKKIKNFIINDWYSYKSKDVILKDNFSTNFALFIYLFIYLLSLIFLDENSISNSENIKFFIEYFSNIFPAIEYKALIARENDLYYFSKFQSILAIFVSILILLILIFPIAKVYLCSLNILKCKNIKYINKAIQKDGYITSITQYSGFILWIVFIIYFMYYTEFNSDMLPNLKYLFNTKIGITFFHFLFPFMTGFFLSIIIIDTIAKLYKFYLKLNGKI